MSDMARPREFEIDDALSDAMNVFWEQGYDAASLPALLRGMGLTRGSFYKAFIDKKSLFIKSLNRYEIEAVGPAVDLLTTGPLDGQARIDRLFATVVDAVRNGDRRGCLLCSAAAGQAAVDTEIADLVHLQLGKMQAAFEVALSQSAAHAEAGPKERAETAWLLLSQYVGLRVLARANASVEALTNITQAIHRLVSLPRNPAG
jgi:TetR/AcrR family transcriptional regulator, transcriptional repressor for nem operon